MKAYNYKVFDRSKFTVVGDPTITADGIASGFGDNKHILSSSNIDLSTASSFEITFSFTSPTTLSGTQILLRMNGLTWVGFADRSFYFTNDGGTSAIWGQNKIEPLTNYTVRLLYKNNITSLFLNDELIGTASDFTYANINEKFAIGTTGWEPPLAFNGSINLSQFSITVDGVEVFNGLKDVYRLYSYPVFDRSKFTVIGNPTITDDGIASGFSGSNYIRIPFTTSKSFTIKYRFNTNKFSSLFFCGI